MVRFFFSPNGRINRFEWWLGVLLPWGFFVVISIMSISAYGDMDNLEASLENLLPTHVMVMLFCLWAITQWTHFCVTVKRYHDRNKSGWWYLIIFIPVFSIWQIIECGMFSGTSGGNDYGDLVGGVSSEAFEAEIAGMRQDRRDRLGIPDPVRHERSNAPPKPRPGKPVFGRRAR